MLLTLVAGASNADQPGPAGPVDGKPTASEASSTAAPDAEAVTDAAPDSKQSQELISQDLIRQELPPKELTAELVYAALVAEIALQRDDYEGAYEHFLSAAELAAEASLAERAVRSALNAERPEAARQALDLWVELEPDAPKAHQLSAFLALESGERATALASLQRVIELGGVPGQGYMQAAQILGRLPEPSDRLAMMRELVAMLDAGADPDAQFALATLAAAAGEDETAAELAERAAALRPDWTEPQLFLVRLLVSREQPEKAQAVLERYISQHPDDAELKLMKA
ncbi:tetratricopeptide repeat protein, partial [Halochromatium sp.]